MICMVYITLYFIYAFKRVNQLESSVWQLHKSFSIWSIQMFRLFWLIKVPTMSSGFLYLILQKKLYFKNLSIRIQKHRQAWEHFFPNFTGKSCEVFYFVTRAAITGTYQLIRQTRLNVDGYCDFFKDKKNRVHLLKHRRI